MELTERTDIPDEAEAVERVSEKSSLLWHNCKIRWKASRRQHAYEACAIYAGGFFGVISELYVEPGYRSAGVAKFLVAAELEIAGKNNWTCLEVGAPAQPKWDRSRKFYLRDGFVEIGPRLRLTVS